MSTSETVVIENSGIDGAWFQIGDETHDFVQFVNANGRVNSIWVGEEEPVVGENSGLFVETYNSGDPRPLRPLICVERANAKVWAFIFAGQSVVVVRGDAKVIFQGL